MRICSEDHRDAYEDIGFEEGLTELTRCQLGVLLPFGRRPDTITISAPDTPPFAIPRPYLYISCHNVQTSGQVLASVPI